MFHRCTKRLGNAVAMRKTALHSYHVSQKATMVPFAGWEMPLQYKGIFDEHKHCRQSCGLFDVSHMGQCRIFGADRERFFEWMTPADIKALPMNKARLTVFLDEEGGILDDLMVTRHEDHLYVVVNAGNRAQDKANMLSRLKEFDGDAHLTFDHASSLLALQGPKAEEVLQTLGVESIDKLPFMFTMHTHLKGLRVRIARCGYTGEDGFEISCRDADAEALVNHFNSNSCVADIGLGARDSLRLEAGMCLHGTDISKDTSMISANLQWFVTKRRWEEGGWIGYEQTKKIRENKDVMAPRRRVGIASKGLCARAHTIVYDRETGKEVGVVTSGCPSPTIGGNVAQGYLDLSHINPGTKVHLGVRNRKIEGEIKKLPFTQPNYKK